jgi:hypothetical protein
MAELPSGAVLVRTWFGDDGAWESLVRAVKTPTEEGYLPDVIPVNDPAFEGLSPKGLKAKQSGDAAACFLADETTLRSSEHPVLAVWVLPPSDDGRGMVVPFRVAVAVLWSVENNINLANMDWGEFTRARDADGVFRGF